PTSASPKPPRPTPSSRRSAPAWRRWTSAAPPSPTSKATGATPSATSRGSSPSSASWRCSAAGSAWRRPSAYTYARRPRPPPRCLGATAGQTLRIYTLQAAVMGLFGAVLGAALGVLVQQALPRVLGPFLPVEVETAFVWEPVLVGVGVGVAVALLFALLPLLR